ncbi:MOSC domain-containing protein [Streptomyces inhibens]|uniref:MOSC domain-containing protein n=1 Tax=Streptomyces inhibens TaxID=2293571 RepID=UPI001EE73FAC|nr:MOSC N-terminal beta barrel domain-containing protein [Streptomyces inhibens]UKY52360.1 MOSC N-terminal beta barrel domain-containing protein [Streptomyces inhibens]
MATVVELISYPVKGCAGVPTAEAELTPAGLAHDRSFMVVAADGVFRSQRKDPRLATVRPEVSADGSQLTLSAPGVEPLRFAVDLGGEAGAPRSDIEMFGMPYRAVDQGEAAAGWLSEVLGAPSRLVRVPPEHDRVTDGLTPGTSGFADSSAVHVLSRASLDDLNARITAAGRAPVPMERFRPNIVVDGWDEPQTEDGARRITVGGGELGFAKLAIRCAVTLVDQPTGTKQGPEPLRTLASYRRVPEGGVAFGSKFSVLATGKVAVGDAFNVTAWGTD